MWPKWLQYNNSITILIEHGLSFDILLDPGGNVQELYRLRGYPTSFFLDGDGVVRKEHVGLLTEGKLREYLIEVGVSQ